MLSEFPTVADGWAVSIAGAGVRSSALPTNHTLARPGFVQAFRAGPQELPAAPDESATITVYALGELVIVSGRVAVTDPIAPLRVVVLDADIAPGCYPVFLSCAEDRAVGLLVRFADVMPSQWEDATALDDEPGWATVEVDTGKVAFMDARLGEALHEERRGFGPFFPGPGGISERMHDAIVGRPAAVVEHEGMNVIMADARDDYPYPVVWGRDEVGRVVAVAIDCCLLALCTRPWEPDDSEAE
jgi:hypothetical protein